MSRNAHADKYVGLNVRHARLNRRISQATLAARLGLHREALSAIENGRQSLTVPQLVVLLDVLGDADPDLILAGVPDLTPTPACRP